MFFVLSSGRSGSKTIATVLNQFRDCVCLHHPQPELVLEATEFYYGDLAADGIAHVLRTTRLPMIDGKIYGEVNLQHSLLFPVIREVFPKSQFVWLIRDGRDAVDSMYCRGWYDRSATSVPAVWHQARLSGVRTGDFSEEQWNGLTRFEKCCWIWRKYNEIIQDHLSRTPDELWRQVYLNALKSSVPSLAEFLGLHEAPNRIVVEKTNMARQPLVGWKSWSDEQRHQFENMCASAMDRWHPDWRDRNGMWRTIEHETPDVPPLWSRGWRMARQLASKASRRVTRWTR